MSVCADADVTGVCLTSSVVRFGLGNAPTSLDVLVDCLFSPKCQRISINFSQNRIFGVGVRDPSDDITGEGSQRHQGGERVREEGDTVEVWSRGPEPSWLVDRMTFCVDQSERRYQSRFRFKDFLIRFGERLLG